MSRRHTLTWGLLAALASPAAAQDIQLFEPAPGTANFLNLYGAETPKHLEFIPSVYVNYGFRPLVSRTLGGDVVDELVTDLITTDLILALGLWDRLEIALAMPLHSVHGMNGDDFAPGDLRFAPKLRLFGLDGPGSDGVGIALALPISFPTGDSDLYVGEGQVTLRPELVFEARLGIVALAFNGGVHIRPEKSDIEGQLELGNEVTYGVGGKVQLGTPEVELIGELFGASAVSDVGPTSEATPLETLVGVRWFSDAGPVLSVGGGAGLISDYGSPEYRLLMGLAWHDRDLDRDGDGLSDEEDACPDEPEDRDGFEDNDGCPEVDNDRDGVVDTADECRDDPEDHDGFDDEDGCPDPDNDADGILDADDRCPDEAEDADGFQDADGCPDDVPDTDGDGILDPDDKCRDVPEDLDEHDDEDGCPEFDNDNDGILDVDDECPAEPETINGVDDADGCPDSARVRITGEKIEILEKVFFNTGKATIKEQSYPVLNEVAQVLVGQTAIDRVLVEGHTDSQGATRYNQQLSQRRAAAVRQYLIGKGVEPGRLEAKGFGETMPITSNNTREGRATNRRVEFTILGRR